MSDKALELLERALGSLDAFYGVGGSFLGEEIRAYLAEQGNGNAGNTLNPQNSASTDALMQSMCRGDKIDCEPIREVMHTILGTNR